MDHYPENRYASRFNIGVLGVKKRLFVTDINLPGHVQTIFLLTGWRRKISRDQQPYLELQLADRTGQIEARVWRDTELIQERLTSNFVAIRGEAEPFKDSLVITIHDLEAIDPQSIEQADFFEASRWTAESLLAQIEDLIANEIKSEWIRSVLSFILEDQDLRAKLLAAPAAKKNHHAYRAGLLEHALSMSRLALRICEHYAAYYPGLLNSDLVVAGCLLHDLAKVEELNFAGPTEYSTRGKLVGHIAMGTMWLETAAKEMSPAPPADLITELQHLVLSHHGRLEYGSPVLPQTAEAYLLHQIDMIDSRLNRLFDVMPKEPHTDEIWSDWDRSLGGSFHFRGENSRSWNLPHEELDLEGPGKSRDNETGQTLNLFGEKK
jgi:3'-5' exoribonuclease